MRKQLHLIRMLIFFAISCTGISCSKELKTGPYPNPAPSSIYNLRRVAVTEGLVLGQTAFQAVVVSDIAGGNFDDQTLIVQDMNDEAAIRIKLPGTNTTIVKNAVVTLDLKGATLIEENGELTLINIPLGQIKNSGQQKVLKPKPVSIAALLANEKYWGPLLVRLDKITIRSHEAGNLLNGDLLMDDEIAEMRASFLPGSVFAEQENPGYAESVTGVAFVRDGDLCFFARDLDDIQIGVSELLEDFEQSSNTNYDSKVMQFITGSWTIDGGITATSTADPKNGKQSIRLQGTIGNDKRNGIVAMNFDLKAVKSITVSHGIYPAAAELANVNPTVFSVEVSRDGGQTYQSLGTATVDTKSTTLSTSTFSVNAGFNEDVRFRVVNTSVPFANNSRPRINIDDILFKF